MTDEEIISHLKLEARKHDKALSYLFSSAKFKTPVIAFLRNKGVSSNDVDILWTDIVVKFALLVRNGKYEHSEKMLAYIKNLANFVALNYFRDRKKDPTALSNESVADDYQIAYTTNNHFELKDLIDEQLSKIGEQCKNLLLYWAHGYSMKEIMAKFKIISEVATRKRKHSCMKKLLEHVNGDEKMSELLKEYYHELNQAL